MMKRGFPQMGGNMNNMMKQLKKAQENMQKKQEEIEATILEVDKGMVKVEITGKKEIKSITIDPEVVDPDDVEMLEDLIMVAVNEAIAKADDLMNSEMGKLTGGLGIPGL
ncbi:MAG: YbaB/EbfC family nucleoid-associated protein [Eubacteriales bacterium]|uniref:YbaB/EbfC family nucleoid-associated protein n=1 Tax=Fenollaria sp. TaxID=1965292 RepID=UPI0025EC67E0|nr:YbaB/EbfC family nucleoid-associated protein [Fenollaria sp.]MDD7340255.1 YbaB/EbfC family nucleoid-associated protein [Eubacteriales bacterium]MDY3106602.1 YbaB/EbfC family nucleoid-associated protein [Fenollaria sp.]